jgi:hypothetical protein
VIVDDSALTGTARKNISTILKRQNNKPGRLIFSPHYNLYDKYYFDHHGIYSTHGTDDKINSAVNNIVHFVIISLNTGS